MQIAFWLIGYLSFIFYYTIRQINFNFQANLNSPPFRWRLHKKTLQAIIADLMIVTGLSCMFDRSKISLGIIGLLQNILMFADLLYMRYYKNPLTLSVIIHNIRVMKEAKESVFAILQIKDLLYLIELPLLIIYVWFMRSLNFTHLDTICSCFGGGMVVIGTIWLSMVYYYSNREPYKWNRKRIARDLGILFFHMADIFREFIHKIKRMRHLSKDEEEAVRKAFIKPEKNIYTNSCKDKCFIMIQMESMQDYLVGMSIDGQEVTPNLNKLMEENIRFTNMYHQTSVANTSDAELLSNNALYPSAEKPSCYEYQNNRFFALGERLRKKGYAVKGFHGNQASTWNRHLVYRQYGYQTFMDNSDMDNDEIYHLGLGDCSFFRQVLEKEGGSFQSEKTFLFMITLSQHHPFKQFADYPFSVGKYEDTMFGDYLKAANYADKALGELVENLKKRDLYDNTLLFMYGDHSGIPELYWENGMLKEKCVGVVDNTWLRAQKVATMLHLPKDVQEKFGDSIPKQIEKVVGQVDILPTLCNLLDLDGRYLLGEDMLSENSDSVAILRDGTVIGTDFIHYVNEDFFYDNKDNKRNLDNKTKQVIKQAEDRLKVSDLVLDYNLIRI